VANLGEADLIVANLRNADLLLRQVRPFYVAVRGKYSLLG
jgi:hypothetical protein